MAAPDNHKIVLNWVYTHGANHLLRLAHQHIVVVTEPALISEILHHPDMDKMREVYAAVSEMMAASGHPDLVTGVTDDYWRLVRKGVAGAFSPANIRDGFKYAAACGKQLVEVLRAKGPDASIDIDQACIAETLDVIGLFGFRHNINAISKFADGQTAEMVEVLARGGQEVERSLANPFRKFTALLTKEGRKERSYFAQYHRIVQEILDDMKARGPPEEDDESLAAHLLRIRDAQGRPLSDERLLPQIAMLFFAGYDTTGHTMSWTLYLISQHPEVEARIAEELRGLGLLATPQQPQPRALEHADLGKLTYLSCAVKESMRLKPVIASGTLRVALRDVVLGAGNYRIPAGTGLWMPSYAVHNSTFNWGTDAKDYRPDRWLQPGIEYVPQADGNGNHARAEGMDASSTAANNGKASSKENYELGVNRDYAVRPPDAAHIKRFMPFSDGRRDCVGQALARMNYTSTLARLLGNFHFELAPEVGGAAAIDAEETMAITLQPGPQGILMRCIPRTNVV